LDLYLQEFSLHNTQGSKSNNQP